MAGKGADDREAIDSAFAAMVAGYHLTAEPPTLAHDGRDDREAGEDAEADPPVVIRDDRGRNASSRIDLDSRWADQHPLFSFTEPAPEPEPEPPEERYDPGAPPPWPRPSAAVLVGWIGVAFAVLTVVAAALGAPIPRWVSWTAVGSFVGGFALLLSRLPRHRPPDSGDGAVL